MNILAGDIGGTKTLLQIAELTDASYKVICQRSYVSTNYEEFSDLVNIFLEEYSSCSKNIDVACFGVAGPVSNNKNGQSVKVTNLPWLLDTEHLITLTHCPRVYLINDFQAVGYGIDTLGADDLFTLQTGQERSRAPRIMLGAGTGLGVAQLIWQQDHYVVIPSEGGHIDLAPTSPQQIELLEFLQEHFDHVSYERILSGSGLVHIYEYLRRASFAKEDDALHQIMNTSDPAAAITDFALNKNDALANEALDLFIAIYGAMAGNLALINLAYGGVYVAGGIAPKIIDRFISGGFIHAFTRKGRMTSLLETIPVTIVMNPQVGLRGAAIAGYRFTINT